MKFPAASFRPLFWTGSSKKDFADFPDAVQDEFGFELYLAQTGALPRSAKMLKGFATPVIELIEDHRGDAFRAVYTARLEAGVYVLHAFKKKSKRGVETPKPDIDLIRQRLRAAADDSAARLAERRKS
jgi:phage-related protein